MGPREFYDEIGSTQDRAIELARAGAEEGTRVVAATQTAGRGRLDHTWASPPGSLYLSIVLPSSDPPSGLLALLLGARLAAALSDRFRVPLRVKWPNDLLTTDPPRPGRKLSGILLDRVSSPHARSAVVAGIGVNVAPDLHLIPRELRSTVATLSEYSPSPPPLGDVEEIVVAAALSASHDALDPARAERLLEECRAALYGVGRTAVVDGVPQGIIRGLAEDGALVVEHGSDLRSIRAGDLRIAEAA